MKFKSIFIAIGFVLVSTAAFAFGFGDIKEWITGQAIAYILTGLLAIGVIAKYTEWVSNILTACGWFLVAVGTAASDRKITKDELQDLKAKWNAVRKSVKDKPDGK